MLFFLGLFFLSAAGDVGAQVYRCCNTYTHTSCDGGRTVNTAPAVSDPQGPKTVLVYLCKNKSGGEYWAADSCSLRGHYLERTERVSANAPWETQLAWAQHQKRQAEQITAPPPVQYRPPQSQGPSVKTQCAVLEERIKELDRMGRAGSQYYDLEWVRRERKNARDTQFRIRC